jgi:hypothetical protein
MFLELDPEVLEQPAMPALFNVDIATVDQAEPDASTADKNSLAKVQIRQRINEFQDSYVKSLNAGLLAPAGYSYKHHFSTIHEDFGCAMYGREMTLGQGAIIIGKIHKHPVMNVLLKGKLVVVSENGRRVIEAPCLYMSEPGVKRVGYVLEDCIWLNVLLSKQVGEEHLDEILDNHTVDSYSEIGLIDSVAALQTITSEVI